MGQNTAIALAPTSAPIATPAAPLEFNPEQRQMIRDTYANGASDDEFAVLMETARARRLNPLLRQIHFVKRWDNQKKRDVWSTQVSIDGLRAIAERTGKYDGQGEPEYIYNDAGKLVCTKVRVYRRDWTRPAVGVAFFDEYKQTTRDGGLNQFWGGKPHVMLAKCAEALAMRKAFPEDTSGLYVPEEMGDRAAEFEAAPTYVVEERRAPPPATEAPEPEYVDTMSISIRAGACTTLAELDDLARRVGRAVPKDHPSREEIRGIFAAHRAALTSAREPGAEG